MFIGQAERDFFKAVKRSKVGFVNPDGYSLRPNLAGTQKHGKQIYTFMLDAEPNDLRFFDGETWLQPGKKFDTDLGSIPQCLSWMPGFSKDDFEISYVFHDNNCRYGGLWSFGVFIKMTRAESDALLRNMIPIEAKLKSRKLTGFFIKWPIWLGVRIGALFGIGVPKKK